MDPITMIGAAAAVIPEIVSWFDDDAGDDARKIAGVVQKVTGAGTGAEARDALTRHPELAVRLREALLSHKAAMAQQETERLRAVNQTMQAEAQAKHWWSSAWRPLWGAVSALAFLVAVAGIMVLAWRAVTLGDQNAMQMVPGLIAQLAILFGIPGAILGVASWHRGMEKRGRAVPGKTA